MRIKNLFGNIPMLVLEQPMDWASIRLPLISYDSVSSSKPSRPIFYYISAFAEIFLYIFWGDFFRNREETRVDTFRERRKLAGRLRVGGECLAGCLEGVPSRAWRTLSIWKTPILLKFRPEGNINSATFWKTLPYGRRFRAT